MIKLSKKTKKLLLLQRNELLTKKQILLRKKFGRFIFTNFLINYFQDKNLELKAENLFDREFNTFKDFLPNKADNILDIGCGLGIIDIFLNKIFSNTSNFYLLDKNRIDKKIRYGFSSNYESYNDLNETKNLLLNNNINKERINLFNVDQKIEIKTKIDLVISLKSMGYHYPVDTYIELFQNCCTEKTIFIYDVGDTQYNEDYLKTFFGDVQIIYEEKTNNILRRLCCTNFKI